MLTALKNRLSGAGQRIAGRTDLLEAVCAASAWVAAADGSIDDNEIDSAMNAVQTNETLSAAFDAATIGAVMDKMLKRAEGGRAGVHGLKKELQDITGESMENKELVLLIALDVADNDGIDDKERDVLGKIATILGLKLADYE